MSDQREERDVVKAPADSNDPDADVSGEVADTSAPEGHFLGSQLPPAPRSRPQGFSAPHRHERD
jgi:hypothetical protein